MLTSHRDVVDDGAGEEVVVGLVDEHGVDRSIVMRQKGVDASAVGELARLDGLVVGGRVQHTHHSMERDKTQ
jgi:hypothetical protein